MDYLKKTLLFILLHSTLSASFASTYTGKLESLTVRDYDGLIHITIIGTRTSDIPNCAKNQSYLIIKNENSPSGKRQLALLMLAQAANKTIVIEGANTCTRWPDGEDIGIVKVLK